MLSCSGMVLALLCGVAVSAVWASKVTRAEKFRTSDGTIIHFKDWGNETGTPVVFSHGFSQDFDVWDAQMLFFGQQGYRVIAHDRRGFGRSQQTWDVNDMDTLADDLAQLIKKLDLKNAIIVGYSWGGGEVARYLSRHGTSRVLKVVLISAALPHLLQSNSNSPGVPKFVFDGLRATIASRKPQFHRDFATQQSGFNRPNATTLEGCVDEFCRQAMLGSIKAEYDGVETLGEDFTEDVKKIDKPTYLLHGGDDQIAPFEITNALTAKLIIGAKLKVYPGYPHGMLQLHADQINQDVLAFIKQR